MWVGSWVGNLDSVRIVGILMLEDWKDLLNKPFAMYRRYLLNTVYDKFGKTLNRRSDDNGDRSMRRENYPYGNGNPLPGVTEYILIGVPT